MGRWKLAWERLVDGLAARLGDIIFVSLSVAAGFAVLAIGWAAGHSSGREECRQDQALRIVAIDERTKVMEERCQLVSYEVIR